LDVDASNPGTSAVTRTLTVPTGVVVQAIIHHYGLSTTGANNLLYLSPLDVNDEAPSTIASPLADHVVMQAAAGLSVGYGTRIVRTNTSGQVRSRVADTTTNYSLRLATFGWIDSRGKDR
jgi:hypothetical protein